MTISAPLASEYPSAAPVMLHCNALANSPVKWTKSPEELHISFGQRDVSGEHLLFLNQLGPPRGFIQQRI
jgi:hypothetical protein